MLSKVFREGNQIIGYILLFSVIGAGLVLSLIEPRIDYNSITSIWWLDLSLTSIITFGAGIFINEFLRQQKFIGLSNIAPGFFLVLFLTGLPNQAEQLNVVASVFLIVFLIRKLISLHNTNHNYIPVFEIGIIIGIIVSLTPEFTGIILLYLVGLTLVKSFSWRDFIIPLLGISFVFGVRLLYLFFTDQAIIFSDFFEFYFYQPGINAEFNLTQLILTGITAIEFLFISKLFGIIEKKNIRVRVHYWLWVWMSLFLLFSMLFMQSPINKVELILLMGLPVSVFSNEFLEDGLKTWIKDVVIALLILGIFALKIIPLI